MRLRTALLAAPLVLVVALVIAGCGGSNDNVKASAPAAIVQLALTVAETANVDVAVVALTVDCASPTNPATSAATPAPAISRPIRFSMT